MIDINELRRLAQAVQGSPRNIHERVNAIHNLHDALPSGVVLEILDRLEDAESDALEQARLNGMGSEREATLMAKLEAAEKERDALRAAVRHEADCVEACKSEIERLCAKIEQMKQQGPVKHEFQGRDGVWYPFIDQRHHENTVADGSWPVRALYALPGAQNVPSVPDGWKLVPIEPTKEMRAAWDSSPICEDDDAEFRRAYSEMIAAAPETKP